MVRRQILSRIQVITPFFLLLFCVFIARIFHIQLTPRTDAAQVFIPVSGGTNADTRGTIFFTDKNSNTVIAARDSKTYNIVLDPHTIEDPDEIFETINILIPTDSNDFNTAVVAKNTRYQPLHRNISPDIAARVKTKKDIYGLNGIFVEEMTTRTYPFGPIASQVLGFVGFFGSEKHKRGLYGIERQYEKTLTKKYNPLASLDQGTTIKPNDVVTLIDPTVQSHLFDTVSRINKKYHAEQTIGIVIRPDDGGIVAMESYPNFDPNRMASVKNDALWVFKNPSVENIYEFGSIFKPLTVAIGFESGAINSSFTYDDRGALTIDKRTIRNHDGKVHGKSVPLQRILNRSLNLGIAAIVRKIGISDFRDYMTLFRFESETDITLPSEQPGQTNLNSPRTIEYITTSYGQGIAISPVAMVRALSSLANGGFLVQPRIIASEKVEKLQSVFSPSTVDEVTRLLVNAYDEALLGGALRNPRYRIAGKTGTAFYGINFNTGEYKKDTLLHSFFGYFPASDPQYLVLLVTVNPQTDLLANGTLARPFSTLSNAIIDYYAIPPDR